MAWDERPWNHYRLGQILDTLFAAQLNRVFGAIARNALAVDAISTPWLHQDTTTITLYGAFEEEASWSQCLSRPGLPMGIAKMGGMILKQVLLSLGVSSDGLPLRMGLRDGNTSDGNRHPWRLKSAWPSVSTGCTALWLTVKRIVNVRWACACSSRAWD